MSLAACVLLNLVLSSCSSRGQAKPSIVCGLETGKHAIQRLMDRCGYVSYDQPLLIPGYISSQSSAPELRKWYGIAPVDLHNLGAILVEKEVETQFQSYFMNVSWSLSTDASTKELTATEICGTSKGLVESFQCIQCNYTEKFQRQTAVGNQRCQFHYIGFPVELETKYFIYAYNLPLANIKENFLSKSFLLTTPGCLRNPNITVCKIETELEVSFTTSSLGLEYFILLYKHQKYEVLLEESMEARMFLNTTILFRMRLINEHENINGTRISVRIPGSDESTDNFVEIIPYFAKCGYDCPRPTENLTNRVQMKANEILTVNSVGRFVCFLLAALLVIVCIIAAVACITTDRDSFRRQFFHHQVQLQLHVEVLVIYPEVCFHRIVLSFAELLHEGCQTDVVLDMWEKRRIAETGPVQWLAAQKAAAADRVIFLSSNPATAARDVSCKSMRNHNNMQNMFTLAVNLFCSDMTNQSSVQNYVVVSFNEVSSQDTLPSALNFCPEYCLMKDIENFCKDPSVSCSEEHGKKQEINRCLSI
ncbi:interleukin-17 receptor B [Phoenicopterus ruber ruber]